MVVIVGHWELGWSAPIKEVELWNFPLRDFATADWWMWPISGVRNNETAVTLNERETLKEIMAEVKGTIVFVEPLNSATGPFEVQWLPDFNHPDDAIYIFGSAGFNPWQAIGTSDDIVVAIPTVENAGVLWPHQALVAVLLDRSVKSSL